MIKGTIKFFNKAKGFGFITPDDGARDVFLPPTTVTGSGAARLKTGQRVVFESEPDVKGPKAVKLELLDEAPKEMPAPAVKAGLTLYYDSADDFEEVLEALKEAGHQPRLVDYAATPLAQDQLKRLALMLREVDQSLVRRYDHLFLELQLDDRFISENDFWTAIVEHPVLINGPVVVAGNKARICKTASEVRSFLGMDGDMAARKPKAISPRMMAMLTGRPVPELPSAEGEDEIEEEAAPPEPAAKRAAPQAQAPVKAKKHAAKRAVPVAEPVKTKKKSAAAKRPQKAKAPAKKSKR